MTITVVGLICFPLSCNIHDRCQQCEPNDEMAVLPVVLHNVNKISCVI